MVTLQEWYSRTGVRLRALYCRFGQNLTFIKSQTERQRSMAIVSTDNSAHYEWGDGCDGWHLVRTPALSVIKEKVPSGREEIRHYHNQSEQFFFVLEGIASIEVNGVMHQVRSQQGIHIEAGIAHQLRNNQDGDLIFIVTSTPPSHGDRVEAHKT